MKPSSGRFQGRTPRGVLPPFAHFAGCRQFFVRGRYAKRRPQLAGAALLFQNYFPQYSPFFLPFTGRCAILRLWGFLAKRKAAAVARGPTRTASPPGEQTTQRPTGIPAPRLSVIITHLLLLEKSYRNFGRKSADFAHVWVDLPFSGHARHALCYFCSGLPCNTGARLFV